MSLDPAPIGGIEPYPDEDELLIALFDSAAFADFEQSIDAMLAALVERWEHLAAPNAHLRGMQRFSGISPKKKAK